MGSLQTVKIPQLIDEEIQIINGLLEAHQVRTRRGLTMCVRSSFIAYGLHLASGEQIKRVGAVTGEISNALTLHRQQVGFRGQALVRLRPDYPLGLEVPHPAPTPLSWCSANLCTGEGVGVVGRSYTLDGPQEEYLSLDEHYHTLVAGVSGGGKSTLMRMALATMVRNSAPDKVRLLLVDLKNDDLTVFGQLPHVIGYAGDLENAVAAVQYTHQVKEWRIANQINDFRLLLVIDELMELAASRETLLLLARILTTGRSLGIHVMAGTVHPAASVLGGVVAAGFTVRFVGAVDSVTTANTIARRKGSGAHLLTHKGDFIRIEGNEMRRMMGYYLPKGETLEAAGLGE